MKHDVYLAGVTTPEWRQEFKSQISSDISVFDPYLTQLKGKDKAEQIARGFYYMDECKIIVFYFNGKISKSARLQLGDAVGHGKQAIVCIEGKVPGKTFIKRYCEYRGVIVVESIEELIPAVEEYAAEVELCEIAFNED